MTIVAFAKNIVSDQTVYIVHSDLCSLPSSLLKHYRKRNDNDFISRITQFNPLPNDKFLYRSKLKAIADDKINEIKKLKFAFERVENTGGKRENTAYLHFLLFAQCFQKPSFSGLLKVGIVW